jgi:hypothetical protein
MAGVSHLLGSSERLAVPTSEPFTPVPTVGLPRAINGGHATAHAPEHALLVPESASNGYGVRPWELTRIGPSPVLARSTVADVAFAVLGDVAAVAALPPPLPPQAASARAIPGMIAARWLFNPHGDAEERLSAPPAAERWVGKARSRQRSRFAELGRAAVRRRGVP